MNGCAPGLALIGLRQLGNGLFNHAMLNGFKRRATAVLKSKRQFHLSSAQQ